ncbi:hypothetical protein QCA50_010751 [Cerrena zonata]|uniref:Succinate dehydrogenase assembly factor 2, mitochondrial n=1 Tax=Cerrena zonata TaxID=2478898 RepID=A0AAW0G0N6_9APHY
MLLRLAGRKSLLRTPTSSLRNIYSTRLVFSEEKRAELKDPWPLPHTPKHMEGSTSPENAPPPLRLERPNEPIDRMRARLVYQTRKRGMLENDLLLSTFAKEQLSDMGRAELEEFDRLLDELDWDIYYWVTDKKLPPSRWANSPILEKLKVHVRNEGKVVRRMPDLQ